MAGLELDTRDENAEVSGHLGLLLHGIDEDFPRLVINPGDKISEALV